MSTEADKWRAIVLPQGLTPEDTDPPDAGYSFFGAWRPFAVHGDNIGWMRPMKVGAADTVSPPTTKVPWMQSTVRHASTPPGPEYDEPSMSGLAGFTPTGPWKVAGRGKIEDVFRCCWQREGILDISQAPRAFIQAKLSHERPADGLGFPGFHATLWADVGQWIAVQSTATLWTRTLSREETQ